MFGHLDKIKRKNRKLINRNKALVGDLISQEPCLNWMAPADGVVCFPRIGFGGDSNAMTKGLANICEVLNENVAE
jgi:hypothetical protein